MGNAPTHARRATAAIFCVGYTFRESSPRQVSPDARPRQRPDRSSSRRAVGHCSPAHISVVLMPIPGPPMMDEVTARQTAEVMAKGFAGTLFLTTEDCHASYRELLGRGVEFSMAPEQMPYGIDSAFRDPSGNSVRLTQVGAGY